MPKRPTSYRHGQSFALALRAGGRRPTFIVLLLLAGWLLLLGQIKPQLLVPVRLQLVDRIAPLLDALSQPIELVRTATETWQEWLELRATVDTLRAENARLKQWEQVGTALQGENRELRQILNVNAEPPPHSLTARVVASTGAPFAASMIVTAGNRDGVKKNMAAMTADGLVGRVIEVGEWSARILLLTDPESRIPVMLPETGMRAIATGDGSATLQPRFLPAEAVLVSGARLVTSGQGGVLPPFLPVAVVQHDTAGQARLYPAADPNRLTYVQLVDYSLAGGAANPFTHTLEAPP